MPNHRQIAVVRTASIAAVLGVSLSACGLPLPVQVASLVANGWSYLTTEKTVSDHGVSVVVGKDCRMLRALAGGDYCMATEPTMTIAVQTEGDVSEAPEDVKGEPEFETEPRPKARAAGVVDGPAAAPSWPRRSIVAVEIESLAAFETAAVSPASGERHPVVMAVDALTDDPELPDRLPLTRGERSVTVAADAGPLPSLPAAVDSPSVELTDDPELPDRWPTVEPISPPVVEVVLGDDPELPDRLAAEDSVIPVAPPIRLQPFVLARAADPS